MEQVAGNWNLPLYMIMERGPGGEATYEATECVVPTTLDDQLLLYYFTIVSVNRSANSGINMSIILII
jgi:hypothetical protein